MGPALWVFLVPHPEPFITESTNTTVGGTSGIGEATARSFVRHATTPRVYLIGRNEDQASKIIRELHALNPESKTTFLKCDVSLLKKVDAVCKEIQEKEEKINVLVLTSGAMTSEGRVGMVVLPVRLVDVN
jgi:NADP-dependent 3-hydroxy acid dehydrogenase YdfG